jgi:hypothetical protein
MQRNQTKSFQTQVLGLGGTMGEDGIAPVLPFTFRPESGAQFFDLMSRRFLQDLTVEMVYAGEAAPSKSSGKCAASKF